MENELLLFDRIEVIKTTINKYGEDNFYLSFSGGKDSTILHYLLDLALPNNKIPRVFINTGIEYNSIVTFVKQLAEKDKRIVILSSGINIKKMLEEKGYPFKSKEHAMRVNMYNKGSKAKFIKKYLRQTKEEQFVCPKKLLYQFKEQGKYNYSNQCCYELKKKPIKKWQKENNRNITITGMRNDEGGNRKNIKGCIITDKSNKVVKFHPLIVVNEEWENYFIEKYKVKLCELYYPPFNFKRTGCKGCPFALELEQELKVMEKYLPNERRQCETIWKYVYKEYRRINYRLKQNEQLSLDDMLETEE